MGNSILTLDEMSYIMRKDKTKRPTEVLKLRNNLLKIRKNKGFTVHEIALKLNISDSFYYKIEQGIRNPTINLAKKISDLLGENIEDLFFEDKMDVSSNIKQAFCN